MEIKDIFTITLSSVALILSLVSTALTLKLKKYEMQRTARSQINSVISELISTIAENRRFFYISHDKRDSDYYQSLSMIYQKNNSLARQVLYLVKQEPDLVTDIEYAITAQALTVSGDNISAEFFWKKSIEKPPSKFYKAINKRGYADFLFITGNHELGRREYGEALLILEDNTDFNKSTNISTLQMWFVNEMQIFNFDEAERWYRRAKALCESISNPILKKNMSTALEQARKDVSPSPGVPLLGSTVSGEKPALGSDRA